MELDARASHPRIRRKFSPPRSRSKNAAPRAKGGGIVTSRILRTSFSASPEIRIICRSDDPIFHPRTEQQKPLCITKPFLPSQSANRWDGGKSTCGLMDAVPPWYNARPCNLAALKSATDVSPPYPAGAQGPFSLFCPPLSGQRPPPEFQFGRENVCRTTHLGLARRVKPPKKKAHAACQSCPPPYFIFPYPPRSPNSHSDVSPVWGQDQQRWEDCSFLVIYVLVSFLLLFFFLDPSFLVSLYVARWGNPMEITGSQTRNRVSKSGAGANADRM